MGTDYGSWGWAGWSGTRGENLDNCNSINNKIFQFKKEFAPAKNLI